MASTPEPLDKLDRELGGSRPFAAAWITTAAGATVGLGLYYLVGCRTGTCLLASTWWSSALYGILMAHLVRATLGK